MKKTILVSAERGETRVAVLEPKTKGGEADVAELYIERRGRRSIVGNIYKGKVDNVLPGMEAAFVDIGLERNGFLHVDEIVLPDGEQAPKRGRGNGRRIDELIKPGQEILVQVVKDPLKTKGARLSMNVSIAGRYLVFAPQGSGVGVSRRLADSERDRLRKMVDRTYKGPGGLIVRTAAHGAKKSDFVREIGYLQKLNEVLERRTEDARRRSSSSRRPTSRCASCATSSSASSRRRSSTPRSSSSGSPASSSAPRRSWSTGSSSTSEQKPLFEKWKIDEEIESTLNRRVDLPSGGYLIIDYTEALTVIDVNSGSFTGRGKGGLEETITKVNTEAADEAVRQLRLRDIGGIIVIDFIDMARARNRDKVLKTMRKALDADKSKSYVVEVSPLGLVEMTRQNVTDGVREILTVPCPTCDGEGVVLSAETVALEGLRKMRDIAAENAEPEAFLIRVNPKVAAELTDPDSGLAELEEETGKQFHFEGGDALAIDTFERGRVRQPRGDRGAGAAVQGRRGGAGQDRRAAHVQRRRRGRPDRLLHRQRHRRRPLRRRAQAGADRGGRALGRDRLAAGGRVDQRRRWRAARRRLRAARIRRASRKRSRGRRGGRGRSRATKSTTETRRKRNRDKHVRSSRKRWQAVQGREGHVPARRSPAREEGDKVALRAGDVPRQGRGRRRPRSWRRSRSRRPSPSTCAGRRSKSSNTRRRRATAAAPGHRSELTKLEVTELKLLTRSRRRQKQGREAGGRRPAPKAKSGRARRGGEGQDRRAKKPRREEAGARRSRAAKKPPRRSPPRRSRREEARREEAGGEKPAAKKEDGDGS